MPTKTQFGRLLAYHRATHWLNQTELEEKLAACGYPVSVGYISRYERGRKMPDAEFVFALMECLDLQTAEVDALMHAILADIQIAFFTDYTETFERLSKRKKEST